MSKDESPYLMINGKPTFNKASVTVMSFKDFEEQHKHLFNPPKGSGKAPMNTGGLSLKDIWTQCGGKEKK